MEIRLLKNAEEKFQARLIAAVAFHMRMEDPAKAREESEKETDQHWGAFNDDGAMTAHIINNQFVSRLDGMEVRNGGIGAVSTLPEYRLDGAVKEIFRELLPYAYRDGEVISTLYPFSHSFYRKFGYETTCRGTNYEIPTNALPRIRHDGWIKMWRPGNSTEDYTALYTQFISRYNTAIFRDDARMANVHIKGDCYKDRYFC